MKRIFAYSCLIFYLLSTNNIHAKLYNIFDDSIDRYINPLNPKTGISAITWKPNGGRFGDNLVSYSKAAYLAYLSGLPLLYFPFPYADQLMLHENEIMYTPEEQSRFYATIKILRNPLAKLSKNNNTLYVSRWKTEIEVDWCDETFVAKMKENIAPRYEIEKVDIPKNVISVAVHVRNGGTFNADTQQEKERCPLRFVPEEFFIEQIDRIAQMFPDQRLYVYIFTDHPHPMQLAQKFQLALKNPCITFGFRTANNSHKTNVLEDFFSMMDFDCLIRPGSHFTRFVQRLGNNKLVIYPESVKEINGKKVIDTIIIKQRKNAEEKWKTQFVVIA
jgi:hypothetical protein